VAASGTRAEIELQRELDASRGSLQAMLRARITAVIGAQRAYAAREFGAEPALRQSLVDLASVCELLAGELPRPRVRPTETTNGPAGPLVSHPMARR
jgi:hypothetical protein